MGNLLSAYKKALVDDILDGISANTTRYYAFASNPVPWPGGTRVEITKDDDTNLHDSNQLMLFGKRLTNTDIVPVTRRVEWQTGNTYVRYDNTLDMSNTNFYVMVPASPGNFRHVYKCIDAPANTPSTQTPDLQQATSFTKSDGYTWRYLYSISDSQYNKFVTVNYMPVLANATTQATANNNTGVEAIIVQNAGAGYISHHLGIVRAVANSTLIQIESAASTDNNFYNNNAIYIYNNTTSTSQLKTVVDYVSNLSGNWVFLDSAANVSNITVGVTGYRISPKVVFSTDGTTAPQAYSVINTTSNNIQSVVVIEPGAGITRCSARLVSNSVYGTGANVYCIVPPPGGHGANPAAELGVAGLAFNFSFAGSESSTIPSSLSFNRIGILKNPSVLNANGSKGSAYANNTFDQLLVANMQPAVTFASNETVIGQTSGAVGIVAKSNTTHVFLVGDKHFSNNETILSSNGAVSCQININSKGHLYLKDNYPLYTQNIDDANRTGSQTETFKLTIQV